MVEPKAMDELKELMGAQSQDSEIHEAMKELFKDKFHKDSKQHDIDLRTRLDRTEIRAMAVVDFLQSVEVPEGRTIEVDKYGNDIEIMPSLATGLDIVTRSIKRHKISLQGKSREEIVRLFQQRNENEKPELKWYQKGL